LLLYIFCSILVGIFLGERRSPADPQGFFDFKILLAAWPSEAQGH
jgi:hypothetical protein